MNQEEKDNIQDRIAKLKKRLLSKIISMEAMAAPIAPENSIGRVSRMDAINNKSVVEAALRNARKDLEELTWAEKHIDRVYYGQCRICNKPINLKRIMLMPGKRKCIKCA